MDESGRTEEMKGRVKEAAGTLGGDDEMRREGRADQREGKLRQAGEKAREAVEKATGAFEWRPAWEGAPLALPLTGSAGS